MMGIKVQLAAAYHHQTIGQVERQNRSIEEMLRHYVGQHQNDWDEYLAQIEFAYNSSKHSTTGKTPFEMVFGFNHNPHLQIAGSSSNSQETKDYLQRVTKNIAAARSAIEKSQAQSKSRIDKSRKIIHFRVGQLVLLSTKNYLDEVERSRPTRKLRANYIGPFEITEVNGLNVTLNLPRAMKIHPTVHVDQVKPYYQDQTEGRYQPKPPPIVIDDEEEFEVDEILDERRFRGVDQALVKWKGYNRHEANWEPLENLEHAQEALARFRSRKRR